MSKRRSASRASSRATSGKTDIEKEEQRREIEYLKEQMRKETQRFKRELRASEHSKRTLETQLENTRARQNATVPVIKTDPVGDETMLKHELKSPEPQAQAQDLPDDPSSDTMEDFWENERDKRSKNKKRKKDKNDYI